MTSFQLNSINSALDNVDTSSGGVDFSGKSLKLNEEKDAKEIIEAISSCKKLHHLTLTGNTLGVSAAEGIAKALEKHPEFKEARWSDMFTGRMKTEIPPALSALGNGMIAAGARLAVLDLSDNAFGPIGVEGLAKLLESDVCSQLLEVRLNNNGLGVTGGRLLAKALTGVSSPKLKVFIAGRNRLENEGAKALAQVFHKMGSLQEISMPQNGIYHVGVTALCEAFSRNPELTSLNLNDNTIGSKGADSIAQVLSRLKNLKHVNFGDCLLKSRGAKTLAQSFKDNSILLETVDLSHNEIGRVACMEVVDCLTSMDDHKDRLTKVVLAGNSLGGTGNKNIMKDRLGDCAELSDGDNSDNEYVTGSEESGDDDDDDDKEEDDDDDNAAEKETATSKISLDDISSEIDANVSIVEIQTDVGTFLKDPSVSTFLALGPKADDVIDTHLMAIKDPGIFFKEYVDAMFKVCELGIKSEKAKATARLMMKRIISHSEQQAAQLWILANSLLVGLALIKSESKLDGHISMDLHSCYQMLSEELSEPYFPENLRDTLKYFIKTKKDEILNLLRLNTDVYEKLTQ